jgi:hypothetical protein
VLVLATPLWLWAGRALSAASLSSR